ncbi:MAG: DUF2892 domain-containing protein [Caldilineaceae bacterium]
MTEQPTLAVAPQISSVLHEVCNGFPRPPRINLGSIERLVSLLIGATVVLVVVRRFLLYSMLVLAGAYLLVRGITGYCPLYASEQIDTRQWRPPWPMMQSWPMVKRSKNHEQDNSTRQMATDAGQS